MGYYDYYDPTDDPRFQEDTKYAEDTRTEFEKDARDDDLLDRDVDLRNEDARLDELREKQVQEAYNVLRDTLSYDEYRGLQDEIRGGRITNEDILERAREISRKH